MGREAINSPQYHVPIDGFSQIIVGRPGESTLDDVVQIRSYVTDIGRWDEIEPVWRSYWGEVWPASTLVQIDRLFDERQMIEMEAVARIKAS